VRRPATHASACGLCLRAPGCPRQEIDPGMPGIAIIHFSSGFRAAARQGDLTGHPRKRGRRPELKTQVTHLNLDEERRRLMAMRSGQLGLTLTAYVTLLIDRDAQEAGLLEFLTPGNRKAAPRGQK
jgi:hypothetical protein